MMVKGNHMFIKTAAIICMISLTGCGSWEPEVQQIPEDVPVSDSETDGQKRIPIPVGRAHGIKPCPESTYGYGPLITSYRKDDWESGIGVRKKRSDDFEEMEKYLDSEDSWEETYDVEYEVSLDEPLTLYQAGMRWWLAPDRMTDWKVESVVCSDDAVLSEERVKHPEEAYLSGYCDEDCVLYTFRDKDSLLYYLAMYRFQDRRLAVLAESETAIDGAEVYKGKIYYSTEIVKEVSYKQMRDGQEQIVTDEDAVGLSLNRMNLDGSSKESVFEYRYPGTEQEILEGRIPYLSLIYEISGDEIIAEVYVGSAPTQSGGWEVMEAI